MNLNMAAWRDDTLGRAPKGYSLTVNQDLDELGQDQPMFTSL